MFTLNFRKATNKVFFHNYDLASLEKFNLICVQLIWMEMSVHLSNLYLWYLTTLPMIPIHQTGWFKQYNNYKTMVWRNITTKWRERVKHVGNIILQNTVFGHKSSLSRYFPLGRWPFVKHYEQSSFLHFEKNTLPFLEASSSIRYMYRFS